MSLRGRLTSLFQTGAAAGLYHSLELQFSRVNTMQRDIPLPERAEYLQDHFGASVIRLIDGQVHDAEGQFYRVVQQMPDDINRDAITQDFQNLLERFSEVRWHLFVVLSKFRAGRDEPIQYQNLETSVNSMREAWQNFQILHVGRHVRTRGHQFSLVYDS